MHAGFSQQALKEEIHRLAPFHHNVELPYGLSTYVPELARRPRLEQTRVDNLVRHAFPGLVDACGGSLKGKKILDAACNCGGFSVAAARHEADYVLGIDIVDRYIEQARFIRNALQLSNVEFKRQAIEDLDESAAGRFDVTLCFGILYNFENPILAMKKLADVTRQIMLVDTLVLDPPSVTTPLLKRSFSSLVQRYVPFLQKPLWLMRVRMPPDCMHTSAEMPTSLWRTEAVIQFTPNEQAINNLLKFLGFRTIEKLKPQIEQLAPSYYSGSRATFLATR